MKPKHAVTDAAPTARMTKPEANRKNSFKSTGPKTQIGKKNVRLNAVKHGFYAREMIIRSEDSAEIEKLHRDLHAQMLPKTALQKLAFKQICYWAWRCELGARLDMRQVNALLFPPKEQESSPDTVRNHAMDSWYAASPEALRKGVRFLDHLKIEVERGGCVPEELKDSVRKGFGSEFLDLLDQPKSPINQDALLLAHHLFRHAGVFKRPLPPIAQEVPEVIVDPQQSLLATLKLIELMKEFLGDLRQMDKLQAAARVSAGDSPPRHFASATRALQRAVNWYQYLLANNL
jgi:hypothetical protein